MRSSFVRSRLHKKRIHLFSKSDWLRLAQVSDSTKKQNTWIWEVNLAETSWILQWTPRKMFHHIYGKLRTWYLSKLVYGLTNFKKLKENILKKVIAFKIILVFYIPKVNISGGKFSFNVTDCYILVGSVWKLKIGSLVNSWKWLL